MSVEARPASGLVDEAREAANKMLHDRDPDAKWVLRHLLNEIEAALRYCEEHHQ